MRAKSFCALFILCLSLGFSPACVADDQQGASTFANGLGHKALAVITDSGISREQKQAKLEELFTQSVDVDWIGQFVLGRFWKTATDEQKEQYIANYRAFTIKHYTNNLSDFTNADFEVSRVRPDDRGGDVVTMHIKRPGAEDVITEFDVRALADGSGFKVYDIIVEGVSMITTQRSEFSSVVQGKGLDYLIGQLKERSMVDQGIAKNNAN